MARFKGTDVRGAGSGSVQQSAKPVRHPVRKAGYAPTVRQGGVNSGGVGSATLVAGLQVYHDVVQYQDPVTLTFYGLMDLRIQDDFLMADRIDVAATSEHDFLLGLRIKSGSSTTLVVYGGNTNPYNFFVGQRFMIEGAKETSGNEGLVNTWHTVASASYDSGTGETTITVATAFVETILVAETPPDAQTNHYPRVTWMDFDDPEVTRGAAETGIVSSADILKRLIVRPLLAKHNMTVKYRIPYTTGSGRAVFYEGEHQFDVDSIPELWFSEVEDLLGEDEVIIRFEGDEDVSAIVFSVQESETPRDFLALPATLSASAYVGGTIPNFYATRRSDDAGETVWTGRDATKWLHVKVVALPVKDSGASWAAGDTVPTYTEEQSLYTFSLPPLVLNFGPTVIEETEQSGSDITLKLTVTDTHGRQSIDVGGTEAIYVDFRVILHNQEIGDTGTEWAKTSIGGDSKFSKQVTVSLKGLVYIEWRVPWTDYGGNTYYVTGAKSFDPDIVPEFREADFYIDTNGDWQFEYTVDEDAETIEYRTALGAPPSGAWTADDPSGAPGGDDYGEIAGSSVQVGAEIFFEARALNSNGSRVGPVFKDRATRLAGPDVAADVSVYDNSNGLGSADVSFEPLGTATQVCVTSGSGAAPTPPTISDVLSGAEFAAREAVLTTGTIKKGDWYYVSVRGADVDDNLGDVRTTKVQYWGRAVYDIVLTARGTILNSEEIARLVTPRRHVFTSLTGSVGTAPSSNATVLIKDGATTIATVTVTTGGGVSGSISATVASGSVITALVSGNSYGMQNLSITLIATWQEDP